MDHLKNNKKPEDDYALSLFFIILTMLVLILTLFIRG